MANSSIYRDLLFKHRHGLPLWKPDPNANLLDIYTKKGISIGDLGLLTDDGGFDYLFNVHAGAEDPVNQFLGTPSTFQPLPPITNQDIIKTEFQHPEKACITRNASYEVTGAGNLGEAMYVWFSANPSSSSHHIAYLCIGQALRSTWRLNLPLVKNVLLCLFFPMAPIVMMQKPTTYTWNMPSSTPYRGINISTRLNDVGRRMVPCS